jgi:hypothetical protein
VTELSVGVAGHSYAHSISYPRDVLDRKCPYAPSEDLRVERGQGLVEGEYNEVVMPVRRRMTPEGSERAGPLLELGRSELECMFARLKLSAQAEPAARLVRHLDVAAEDQGDRVRVRERVQPRGALAVGSPVVDEEEARIERVAGQQDLCPPVVQGDV